MSRALRFLENFRRRGVAHLEVFSPRQPGRVPDKSSELELLGLVLRTSIEKSSVEFPV